MNEINLGFGLSFDDLYSYSGIQKIDSSYSNFIKNEDYSLYEKLQFFRDKNFDRREYAEFLVEFAPIFERFIIKLFSLEKEASVLSEKFQKFEVLYQCKKKFVQRKVLLRPKEIDLEGFDHISSYRTIEGVIGANLTELSFASKILELLDNGNPEESLDIFKKYTAWACFTKCGQKKHNDWVLFKHPAKYPSGEKPFNLERFDFDGIATVRAHDEDLTYRDGFSLTSESYGLNTTLDQANYCIHCHKTGKDSCSKGLEEKSEDGATRIKHNAHGEKLSGCPLNEKISEMHLLKTQGYHLASLATAMIDNPMLAATGYRICNECMKSCIYQKQDSVNIPKAETGILRDVLNLPWGFEIYRLFTQWNPLKSQDYILKPDTGKKILVAGLGPAGFTLAHYLLNEGHIVVAVDGLKIEPLDPAISGINSTGDRVSFEPIKNISSILENLDIRPSYGFGGVAEYGITVRWDKNFLKIIRLILERNSNFRMYGGVRFGSNIDYNTSVDLGFDHIALSMGAGRPNLLNVPNALALGVRTASDFLMSLQLTGAAKASSIANLQVRLPIVVIGGGLTAIDTATEAMAYYVREVEKFYDRYIRLCDFLGKENVESSWDGYDQEVANEFIEHAKIFVDERRLANEQGRAPNFIHIIRKLGGVKMVYRKHLEDAPSYKLNPEEVEFAFEEGIEFVENATLSKINIDHRGALKSLDCIIADKICTLPARTLLVSVGTNPNTMLSKEDKEHFELDGRYFKLINSNVFIHEDKINGVGMSVFGDLHPKYKGNVVKAMASAKDNYKYVSNSLSVKKSNFKKTEVFFDELDNLLLAKICEVKELAPKILEVIIRAPLAARRFKPGQFYKLQNYEYFAQCTNKGNIDTILAMEGVALTGAWVDKEQGLISTIVLEMGGSSNLCRFLKKDEPIVLMGPTGVPTEITSNEVVLLAGGGLGNAVLFSIGKALRQAGSKVLYFAGYKKSQDRYKIKEIEEAADQVVWCCDEAELEKNRSQDVSIKSNIVDAILAYSDKNFGSEMFEIEEVDRIISIGSSGMMEAVHAVRKQKLSQKLKNSHKSIASINSPMQCMMKEICAQCLQKHIDPVTGLETYVYSCANQDQDTDYVDFKHLNARLRQNSLVEKLTAKWLEYLGS